MGLTDKRREILFCLLLFTAIFIRYCYYGFEYYYQLDDYIQYHNFAVSSQPFEMMLSLGLLNNRPLASIADIFLWSHFYPVMLIGVALISLLFAISACLLRWIFNRHFGVSYLFCVIYTLLPLGFEGTYWMSASTRIVVGLFFASLALFEFQRWCDAGRLHRLLLFIVLQLISCAFYEQVLLFSTTACLLLMALNYKNNKSRSLYGAVSLLNVGIYFLITAYFSQGNVFSGRGSLILPTSHYYWNTFFPSVVHQLKCAFLDGGFLTLARGLKRGFIILLNDFNFIYVVLLLIVSSAFFLLIKTSKNQLKRPVSGIITGVLLSVAPISIFFILDNSWLSLRGTVTSFCGLALVVDILFAFIFKKSRNFNLLITSAVSLFTVVCCISSISEVHDYKETTRQDRKFVQLLSDTLKSDQLMSRDFRVGILNLEPSYLDNQNYYYHEHIHGVTESGWVLHGALESVCGYYIPDLSTFPKNPMYAPWNREVSKLRDFDVLYLYFDEKLLRVNTVERSDGEYDIFNMDGKRVGYTWEDNNYGYLELELGVSASP